MRTLTLTAVLALVMLAPASAFAVQPRSLSYQGLLTGPEGQEVPDGRYGLTFRIYDASAGGTPLWVEPDSVTVEDGVFSVVLGHKTSFKLLPFDVPYWLGITIGDGSEMIPRVELTSAPYAMRAAVADSAVVGTPNFQPPVRIEGTVDPYPRYGLEIVGPNHAPQVMTAASGESDRVCGYRWGQAFGDSTAQLWGLQMDPQATNTDDLGLTAYGGAGALLTVKHDTGRIGIGTATPTAKLEVAGLVHSNTEGFKFPDGTIQTTAAAVSYWAGSGSNIYNTNSGRVGIGTTNPTQKLDVNGVARALHLTIPNGSDYGYWIDSDKILYAPNQTIWRLNDMNTVLAVEMDLDEARFTRTVHATAGGFKFPDGTLQTTAAAASYWAGSGTSIYNTNTGNVGLGTNSPAEKLHVSGKIQCSDVAARLYLEDTSAGGEDAYVATGGGNDKLFIGKTLNPSPTNDLVTVDLNSGGLYSVSSSSSVPALYGKATANGGSGVYGETWSQGVAGGSSVAVYGWGPASGQSVGGATLGVLGRVNSYQGTGASVPVGVFGWATATQGACWGVAGETESPHLSACGVKGTLKASGALGRAIWGEAPATGYAGYFQGNAHVTGTLTKGGGGFKVDHPLDPTNQYLYHSFVESPDMMNIYNGNVLLDANGEAWVELPAWFEALNRDFRYQLTCLGRFAPVYVAEPVRENKFKISGGAAGMEVSWQVTGIRHDPFAEHNRIPVEQQKLPEEVGTYMHPEAYGAPGATLLGQVGTREGQ